MSRLPRLLLSLIVPAVLAALSSAVAQDNPRPRSESRTLTLGEAVGLAVRRSPEIALAQAEATRAGAVVNESRSLNRPQVATGTGLAYNNGFPLSIEGAAPSIVQIALSQTLFNQKNKNLILEAEAGHDAAQTAADSAANDLEARVALVYYELHQAERLHSLWSENLAEARNEEQVIQTLVEAGRARPLDLTLARTGALSAQQQALVAGEQRRLAQAELSELTGLPASVALQTVEPALETDIADLGSDTLLQRALEIHPEIRQAEANIRARDFHVQAEKADKYPRLDIISEYALFSRTNNYQDFFNQFTRHNFLMGLSLQVPLFDGFRSRARVAQSQQEASEARLRLQRLKADLRLNIERAASAVRIARGAIELARSEVNAAKESLDVGASLLQAGRMTLKEVGQIRAQLREKQLANLEADRALFQREIELLRITGSLPGLF